MYISMCACVPGRHTSVCVLYDRDHNRQVRLRGRLGPFVSQVSCVRSHGVLPSFSSLSSCGPRVSYARGFAAVPGSADRPAIWLPPREPVTWFSPLDKLEHGARVDGHQL